MKTRKKKSLTLDQNKDESSQLEKMIYTIFLNVVKNVFTCTGKEPEGEKLLQYIAKNPDLILTEPLPIQYTEVTSDSLCSYLLEHFSKEFQAIKVDLTGTISRECVYSLFYIWIYNHKLIGKLDIELNNDNSLINLSLKCFTQYKREILDGNTIQLLSAENDTAESSQKGGNLQINLTIYLFLLLVVFTPYVISPDKSDIFEAIKLDQPEKQFQENLQETVANQMNAVIKVGESHFNNEVQTFLKVIDIAALAPYELLVKKDTVNKLNQYYDYGGNYATNKMGFTLRQTFNFLLKLKTKVNKLHDHLFKFALIKLYKDGNEKMKKTLGFVGASAFGIEDQKSVEKQVGDKSRALFKAFIYKTIAQISPSIVGPLYAFDKVVLGIDDINNELNENESSLNWGVSILQFIENLQTLKKEGTEKMKKIVQRIELKKKSLHTFDLSKEDFQIFTFMKQEIPSFISNAQILEDVLEEGGPFYGGKKYKNRKTKKAKRCL